jgi:hypothetical protein
LEGSYLDEFGDPLPQKMPNKGKGRSNVPGKKNEEKKGKGTGKAKAPEGGSQPKPKKAKPATTNATYRDFSFNKSSLTL